MPNGAALDQLWNCADASVSQVGELRAAMAEANADVRPAPVPVVERAVAWRMRKSRA